VVVSKNPVGLRRRQWLLVADAELEEGGREGGRKVSAGEGKMGENENETCVNLYHVFFFSSMTWPIFSLGSLYPEDPNRSLLRDVSNREHAKTESRFLRTSQVKKDHESGTCFAAPPGCRSTLSLSFSAATPTARFFSGYLALFFVCISQILWSSNKFSVDLC
jgi:hypothetical protein